MDLASVYILIIAFLLDFIAGDPRQLPHLIVGYGKLVGLGESLLNRGKNKRNQFLKGVFLTLLLVAVAFFAPYILLNHLLASGYTVAWYVLSVILLFYCLANRTLINEGKAVFMTLKNEGLDAGRKRLSWIVGRNTSALNEQQIRKATLETMSENLSDGVIAPLFYFFIFGIPGAMAYKMINTLDSMIGYKNEKYLWFGKFAARLDDVANFMPARLTALLMLLVSVRWKCLRFVFSEGRKHSSPNAGYPEAALACIMDCRFGGPNMYHGRIVDKPYIGTNTRKIGHREIDTAVRINIGSSIVFCLIYIFVVYLA